MTEPALTVSVDGNRLYKHPVTGDLYPSVTSIIGCLDKPALVHWSAKETAKAAWAQRHALIALEDEGAAVDMLKSARYRSMEKRANLGTTVHAIAEALATDQPLPKFDVEAEEYADQFLRWVADFDVTFEAAEISVFNTTHGYAGTADGLARIGGHRWLFDHKTSKSGIFPEVALQLAALRNGEVVWDFETGDLSPMPVVDGCIAVWLRPDFYRVYAVDAGEAAFRAFLGARATWDWMKAGESKGVISPSMSPRRLAAMVEGPKLVAS